MAVNKRGQSKVLSLSSGDGIICTGLPRSGTASLAKALEILGIENVHHGVKMHLERPREMIGWGQAAWSNYPYLKNRRLANPFTAPPSYVNPADTLMPWTRSDWDRLIGQFRVSTDFGAFFTEQLLAAYPEARVIHVQRPVDKWVVSFRDSLLDNLCFGVRGFILCTLGPLAGLPTGIISKDLLQGFLSAKSRDESIKRLPVVHREHSEMVRRTVPAGQILEYKLSDGWEPLCEFFNVPVPDEPFPHINEGKDFRAICNHVSLMVLLGLGIRIAYWSLAIGASVYALRRMPSSWLKAIQEFVFGRR